MTSMRTVNNPRGWRPLGGQTELCLPRRCPPSVWRRGNISDERGRRGTEGKIGMMYKGKRQRIHPHRKQRRVAAAAAALVGRRVFYTNLAGGEGGESDTHTSSYFYLCEDLYIFNLKKTKKKPWTKASSPSIPLTIHDHALVILIISDTMFIKMWRGWVIMDGVRAASLATVGYT